MHINHFFSNNNGNNYLHFEIDCSQLNNSAEWNIYTDDNHYSGIINYNYNSENNQNHILTVNIENKKNAFIELHNRSIVRKQYFKFINVEKEKYEKNIIMEIEKLEINEEELNTKLKIITHNSDNSDNSDGELNDEMNDERCN